VLGDIVNHPEQIRLAADLAIFDIGLLVTGEFVHYRLVELPATGTLKAGIHLAILEQEFARSVSIVSAKGGAIEVEAARDYENLRTSVFADDARASKEPR
jgi:hypothetical protein